MPEKKEYIRASLLKLADSMCVTDVTIDIKRYGLGIVLSEWKQEIMDLVEIIDA